MKDLLHLPRGTCAIGALAVATLLMAVSARANVYATDIKLNGSNQQTTTSAGNPVPISYILSDTATLGVVINVYSNGVPIRSFSVPTNALATNGAGLSLGTNTIFWDGNDSTSNSVGVGAITVSVTASSAGYPGWTLLTTNNINTGISSGGYYTWAPRGLAVDTVTNSPAYGRVFVANSQTGPNAGSVAGDHDAILMFNADGSASDAGAFGNGGYPIHDANFTLPQKLRLGDDDRLYMNDADAEQIVAFDPGLQTNKVVLNGNNYFANPFVFELENEVGWFSLDITAANTTNGLIWLGEYDAPGAGVWFWRLVNGVADPTDPSGTNSVVAGPGSSLNLDASGGLMADLNSDVFVSQYVDAPGDATNGRCMMFGNANGFIPATNAQWDVGAGDDSFRDINDTTIDSRKQPNYVACAMVGPNVEGLRILNATNGSTAVANLDPANTYFATAWDSVGNLYGASDSRHAWRVWSPPGSGNTATTFGIVSLKTVDALTILAITNSDGVVSLSFTASSTNALSNFTLLSSSNVAGNYAPAAGYVISHGERAGLFTATVPTNGALQFYIIKR